MSVALELMNLVKIWFIILSFEYHDILQVYMFYGRSLQLRWFSISMLLVKSPEKEILKQNEPQYFAWVQSYCQFGLDEFIRQNVWFMILTPGLILYVLEHKGLSKVYKCIWLAEVNILQKAWYFSGLSSLIFFTGQYQIHEIFRHLRFLWDTICMLSIVLQLLLWELDNCPYSCFYLKTFWTWW